MNHNCRRQLLIAASGFALARVSAAQTPSNLRTVRLGVLFPGTAASGERYFAAFFDELAVRGFVEGRNLTVVRKFADGSVDRLDALAGELAAARVDLIFAPPTPAVIAARKAAPNTPIVFSMSVEPVASGLVKSLAQPGGLVTGTSTLGVDLIPKRIELLRELAPGAARIGVLYDSREPTAQWLLEAAMHTARQIGASVVAVNANSRDDLAQAFVRLKDARAQVLLVFEGSLALINRQLVLSQAAQSRLPALYAYPEMPAEGGLISYSADMVDQFRRAAGYVARIFNGTKPADLPVEQPTRFVLIVNRRTATALGIKLPLSILLQATEVIE